MWCKGYFYFILINCVWYLHGGNNRNKYNCVFVLCVCVCVRV